MTNFSGPIEPELDLLVAFLSVRRFPINSEVGLQEAITSELAGAGIAVEAEARLDGQSRIDFLTPGGVGIETKIDGSRLRVWRQCQRYARHDRIRALILLGSVAMPPGVWEICGKPFRFVSIGRSWL